MILSVLIENYAFLFFIYGDFKFEMGRAIWLIYYLFSSSYSSSVKLCLLRKWGIVDWDKQARFFKIDFLFY